MLVYMNIVNYYAIQPLNVCLQHKKQSLLRSSKYRCEGHCDVTTSQMRVQVDVQSNDVMTYTEQGKLLGVPDVSKRIIPFNLCV